MVQPGAGVLLIADPFLKDPNFMRTVVFLTEHRDDGTIGFVLNRQYENTLDELLPEVEGHQLPVYFGGPVQTNTIHFLHSYPQEIPGGIEVMKGVYWGGDFESTKELLNSGRINKNNIRFFLGYTGWSESQLQSEMNSNSWIIVSNSYKNKIIGKSSAHFWKEQIKELGGDYLIWSNAPENPYLN